MNPKNKKSGVSLTLTRWAKELRIDPKTMASRLKHAGHTITRHGLYGVRDVCAAVYGDVEQEKLKALRLKNAEAERESAVESGILRRQDIVEEVLWEKGLSPLRDALLNLSKVVAAQCNPKYPEIARKVLDAHVAGIMKQLNEALPKTTEQRKEK